MGIKVPVVTPDGRQFESITACAAAFGVSHTTVIAHLRSHGHLGRLGVGAGRHLPGYQGYLVKMSIPFTYGGRTWPSRSAAARDLGVSYYAFKRALGPSVPPEERAKRLAELREKISAVIMRKVAAAEVKRFHAMRAAELPPSTTRSTRPPPRGCGN